MAALVAASFVIGGGCADVPETTSEHVASRSERVQIVASATCTVEWTKIDYKAPAGQEFIELRVTKTSELVKTLGDCGLGGINLYTHADPCVVPYRSIPLQNISIQGQYVVICQDQVAGADCDVKINADDWLHDTATEIGFFSVSTGVNGSLVPMLWAQYATPDADAECIPPLTSPALHRIQDEAAATPATGNAWCPPDSASGAFVILDRASIEPRQSYTCPSGTGGAGGTGGTAGAGGSSTGGAAGSSAGGAAGSSAGGAAGAAGTSLGGSDSGGADSGGTDSGGADSGGADSGGTDSGGTDSGGTDSGGADSGGADSGGTDSGGADSGGADSGGADSGGADSGNADSGRANSAGNMSHSAGAGTGSGATSGEGSGDGLSLSDIAIEGGGCACSTAASGRGRAAGWLGLVAAMSVLSFRRRHVASRRPKR